jgi:hypothetical protein
LDPGGGLHDDQRTAPRARTVRRPIVVEFTTVGATGALALLIFVLIYQQVENYLISPRI